MAYNLHPAARKLIESRPCAHLVTMRPTGRPHVSFVWIDVTDDGQIQFATPPWRVKGKNLQNDPECILSIQDNQKGDNGLLRHLLIEGIASIDDDPRHGREFLDQLFYKYTGGPNFEKYEGGHLLITVDITRVSGVGPWHTGKTTSIGTPI